MIIDLDKYKKIRETVAANGGEEIIIKLYDKLFHLVDDEDFEIIQTVNEMANSVNDPNTPITSKINIVCNGTDSKLTYEEYEKIKQQIDEALDKTFKPKAEKMN